MLKIIKKKVEFLKEQTWNYDFQLFIVRLQTKNVSTLKFYQIKLISRFKCVMGQDHLIFDD